MISSIFPQTSALLATYRDRLMIRLFGASAAEAERADGEITPPRPKTRRWVTLLIASVAFLFYAALLVYGIRNWDFATLQTIHFDPLWIGIATAIQIAGYSWAVYVRKRVLGWLGYELPFSEHQKIYAYSDLAAKVPGIFWGYASRIYLYHRLGVARSVAGIAIVLELITLGVASSLIGLLILLIEPSMGGAIPVPVLLGALAVCALATNPRFLRVLVSRFANQALRDALERLPWGAMVFSVSCYAGIIVMGGLCLFGIGMAINPGNSALALVMIGIWALTLVWGVLISWLPADFGLRQGPLLVLLGLYFSPALTLVIILAWRIWLNLIEIMWGAVALTLTLIFSERPTSGEPS